MRDKMNLNGRSSVILFSNLLLKYQSKAERVKAIDCAKVCQSLTERWYLSECWPLKKSAEYGKQ